MTECRLWARGALRRERVPYWWLEVAGLEDWQEAAWKRSLTQGLVTLIKVGGGRGRR